MQPEIQLIVGLGNPSARYAGTRHNIGACFVQTLCHQEQLRLTPSVFKAHIARWNVANRVLFLMIPTTYMNLSGEAVGAFVQYHHFSPAMVLVIHDELDIPAGVLQWKMGGGHAGHNGLRNIIHHLQSTDFPRIRIGIGHPGDRTQVSDYVLSKPTATEQPAIDASMLSALTELKTRLTQTEGSVHGI